MERGGETQRGMSGGDKVLINCEKEAHAGQVGRGKQAEEHKNTGEQDVTHEDLIMRKLLTKTQTMTVKASDCCTTHVKKKKKKKKAFFGSRGRGMQSCSNCLQ